jgi:hypothetical protein
VDALVVIAMVTVLWLLGSTVIALLVIRRRH